MSQSSEVEDTDPSCDASANKADFNQYALAV